ncbi:uncharacterized protein [Takifugu rubripes]|uniref:uncharacterized protein n=1 Tax=Takifugu rubripes TaxID=31033 RepID=UPI0005D15BCE|nr:uncharacterized protein LOC105417230 [Takifugu rubripes]XP_011607877.1 uncharacterized protein LOC105417230 [Takifugu rubripes]|eukprot:XP_011607876.1 PREDICTED: uncharacterized protein LOC105417230 [Takifugu rubripes]
MLNSWILLSTLLLAPGVKTFLLYNAHHSLCLHESKATGEVLLQVCIPDSESQQWMWIDGGMLMGVASSKCLLAVQRKPLKTHSCKGLNVDPSALMWGYDEDSLISRNISMFLSVDGQQPTLSHSNKFSKWKILDTDDLCRQSIRHKRSSHDDPNLAAGNQKGKLASMTEEEQEYLRWYYRTEDPTMWKFVLIGVAFLCLLAGFLLLGLGAMANRNRKEIAKYKAAAMAQNHGEELQCLPQDSDSKVSHSADSPFLEEKPSPCNLGVNDLKAGSIVVTWNDGNTSELFPNPSTDDDNVVTGDKINMME